jgi:hypothetical protein
MRLGKGLVYLGIVLIASSVILLAWGLCPNREHSTSLKLPGLGRTVLSWTPRIRMGDAGEINLTLQDIRALDPLILPEFLEGRDALVV